MSQGKEGSLCARQFSFPSSIEKINVTTGYESGLATQRQAQKIQQKDEICPCLFFVAFASVLYFPRRQTLMLTLAVMLLVNTRHKSYRGELDIIQ